MAITDPTTTSTNGAGDVVLDVRGLRKTYDGQNRSVEAIA